MVKLWVGVKIVRANGNSEMVVKTCDFYASCPTLPIDIAMNRP